MRKSLLVLGVLALLAAVPVAVLAADRNVRGSLDRQAARTIGEVSTSSTEWRNVPGLRITRCTRNQATVTMSVLVSGAPVQFRAIMDGVPEAPLDPRVARFVPSGAESFSHTFVGNTAPFEADDTHQFNIQWRSPSGAEVTIHRGVVNLLFENGRQGCP